MPSTTEGYSRITRVARGDIPGTKSFTVVGNRYDIPIFTDSFIWYGPNNIEYTFTNPSTERISIISSDNVSDVGQQILVEGLDENWDEVAQIATLNGQNKVALSTELIRINSVVALQNLNGYVYVYEDGAITAGVPNDLTTVKGYVDPAYNRAFNTAYSIPAGKEGNAVNLLIIGRPAQLCCLELTPYIAAFNGSNVAAAFYPIVNQGSTFLPLIPKTYQNISEKSDTYVVAYTDKINGGVTVIVEFEIFPKRS